MSAPDIDALKWRKTVEYVKAYIEEHGATGWDDIPPPPPEPPPPPPPEEVA